MIALDSNILVYAQQQGDPLNRHIAALELIGQAGTMGAIVPLQVLGEFLNVCRTKLKQAPQAAVDQVVDYLMVLNCPETVPQDLVDAALLAEHHSLQFFDALTVSVAARAGATVLLSEDMHDGLQIAGLRIINPFNQANRAEITDMLTAD